MREILFRGKWGQNGCGGWIEGYLVAAGNAAVILRPVENKIIVEEFEVGPSTVGQYTGQKDINGKRIFEGDIVSFKRVNALGYTTSRIGDVRYYDKLPIFYIMATTGDAWDWVDCEEIEVIGNIHDNQELMKQEAGK